MDWMKIGSALLLVMMLVYLFPRARHMMKNSPKGSTQDWLGIMLPLGMVVLFVLLLILLVQNL